MSKHDSVHEEAVRIIDPALRPHRLAPTAGDGLFEGPPLQDHLPDPGFDEYRQIHLAEINPGQWSATPGVDTAIPADRRIDGVAEVTFPVGSVAASGPEPG
jgi:hypothetical protein